MAKIVYVTLDGVRYKARVTASNGKWHCIILGPGPLSGKTVKLDETLYTQAATKESGPQIVDGTYTLLAPITGRVMQLNVKAGDEIKKDSCALVIEAMKMENELNVEVSGTLQEVLVQEGDMVESGQELVKIEVS